MNPDSRLCGTKKGWGRQAEGIFKGKKEGFEGGHSER